MAKKQTTDSFIHEVRLITTPHDLKTLETRLDVARQLYNACLGEAMKRLLLVRESTLYSKTRLLPRLMKKERSKGFNDANKQYGFDDYALQNYVLTLRKNNWLGEHIDALTAQKIANRAYKAVAAYAIGLRGKPRFKTKNRLSSVEGKNNASGIRWQDSHIEWSGLKLAARLDTKDKHGLEAHALSCTTKYVRLVKRTIKGQSIWFAQLVQAGKPYLKPKNTIESNIVGLDIGPSTIAMVNDNAAKLTAFCEEVADFDHRIKQRQRKIARSLRAMNQAHYEPNTLVTKTNGKTIKKLGKPKKGYHQPWHFSKRCLTLKQAIAEDMRKMASARNTAQGQLANTVLAMGNIIKTEKLSYKALQKNFGKRIKKRAPGMFLSKLRYKAANAGGVVIEFNTQTTALSQTCHCGNRQKKRLKERWHRCEQCGAAAQRDLFSAHLAMHVDGNHLNTSQAQMAWVGVDTLLEQAVLRLENQVANDASLRRVSFGLNQRQSRSSVKEKSIHDKALDVVSVC